MIRRLLAPAPPVPAHEPWGPLSPPVDPWAGHPLFPAWLERRHQLRRHPHPIDPRSRRNR